MSLVTLVKKPAARIGAEAATRWSSAQPYARTQSSWSRPWVCQDCRIRVKAKSIPDRGAGWKRAFSTTTWRRDDTTRKPINPNDPDPIPDIGNSGPNSPATSRATEAASTTPASSSTTLPSHTASQRSDVSKRMSKILDDLLAKASIASQHINAYTGTDYSGIEALRREIGSQEQKVRDYIAAVDEAKSKHIEADAKQKSAQREIVGLLERKTSWSPADLERYMSLVRSEHLNEQDVQAAKDRLKEAERDLENSRALLEKLERKQYHEEQIWSDTIRRNSTWVTFGLMGVNIVLLLAQILIFEPHRRKRIVRDVKSALDEKTLAPAPAVSEAGVRIEGVVQPKETSTPVVEQVESDAKQPFDGVLPKEEETVGKAPLAAGEMLPPEAADFAGAVPAVKEGSSTPSSAPSKPPASTWEVYQDAFRDLFSERLVQLRKVDVTNTALQGAATGVAVMGLLFVLLRPK